MLHLPTQNDGSMRCDVSHPKCLWFYLKLEHGFIIVLVVTVLMLLRHQSIQDVILLAERKEQRIVPAYGALLVLPFSSGGPSLLLRRGSAGFCVRFPFTRQGTFAENLGTAWGTGVRGLLKGD